MREIEMELWKASEDNPHKMKYAGQRSAEEVFEELRQRLDSMGYLPDEYFLLDQQWKGGRLIPKDADISCSTDYGGSEGVYVNVCLEWYEQERGMVTSPFITGKTLGETGAALDRMFLIASAITKAFHGDGGQYNRFVDLDASKGGEMVISLTQPEQHAAIEALLCRRLWLTNEVDLTEQLLRRLTGSITDYIDLVGQRPKYLTDFDRAVLAIRDGEYDRFKSLCPAVLDHADDLLVEAAGRAGRVGTKMTELLLDSIEHFEPDSYLCASKRSADICDEERALTLMKCAESHVDGLDPAYYGQVILCALSHHRQLAAALIRESPMEWIAHAPSALLTQAISLELWQTAEMLVKKGLAPKYQITEIIRHLICNRQEWMLEILLEHGMSIPQDYKRTALQVCLENNGLEAAKALAKHDPDLADYCRNGDTDGDHTELMNELCRYAETLGALREENKNEAEA